MHAGGSDLEGALNAVDALDATNVGEDGFELALIRDFQAGGNTGVLFVRTAFQSANVGASSTDYGGDVRKQTSTILGADYQFYREGGDIVAPPFDGNAALGLVHQVLDVRAS